MPPFIDLCLSNAVNAWQPQDAWGRCKCKLTSGVDISCVNETPTPKIRADINRFQARYITVSFTCIIQDRSFNSTSKPEIWPNKFYVKNPPLMNFIRLNRFVLYCFQLF